MKLRFTPQTVNDLDEIKNYLLENTFSQNISDNALNYILDNCTSLKSNPYLGISMSKITNKPSEYRYLICGKHLIFYCIKDNYISIIRILDSRTDYLKLIFTF